MSYSLFTVNQAKDGLELSENQIANYLSRDLGIASTQTRNKSIMAAMLNPSAQLVNYHIEIEKLLEKAAKVYKEDYGKLLSLGIPSDKAQQVAKAKAATFMKHETMILDIQFPLANDINTLASATAKTSVNVNKK